MSKQETRLTVVLVVLTVIALIYLWPSLFGGEASGGIAYDGYAAEQVAGSQTRGGLGDLPELHLDYLEREKQRYSGSRRNLFAAKQERRAVAVVSAPEPELEPVIQEAVAPAPPKLRGCDYVGFSESSAGIRTAVFSWKKAMIIGREGDVIDDTFKIVKLTKSSATIHVTRGDFEQVLRLNRPRTR